MFDEKSPTLIRLTRAVFGPPTGARRRLQARLQERLAAHHARYEPINDTDAVYLGFLSLSGSLAFLVLVMVHVTPELALRSMEDIPDRFVLMAVPPPPDLPERAQPIEEPPLEVDPTLAPTPAAPAETEPTEAAAAPAAGERDDAGGSAIAAILGTLGENSSDQRVRDLFDGGDPSGTNLDALLNDVSGIETASLGMSLRRGRGEGGGRADIGALARARTGGIGAVEDAPILQPTVTGEAQPVSVAQGDLPQLRAAIRRYRGQLKACYERSLKMNPSLEGRVELNIAVEDGAVLAADVLSNQTGDPALAACIVRQVERWQLPTDEPAEILLPFVFAH